MSVQPSVKNADDKKKKKKLEGPRRYLSGFGCINEEEYVFSYCY